MLKFVLLVLAAHLVHANNSTDTVITGKDRVLNGAKAPKGKYPNLVLLHSLTNIYTGSYGMCTGTAIRDDVIITAAHCVCGESPMFYAFPGALNSDEVTNGVEFAEIRVHPRVQRECNGTNKPSGVHDMALLRTKEKMNIANASRLYFNPMVPHDVTVVGYGLDEKGDSGILKEGVVMTLSDCSGIDTGSNDEDTSAGVCYDSMANWQQTGSGDSGGPAFSKDLKVVAVNSGKRTMSSTSRRGVKTESTFGVLAGVSGNGKFVNDTLKEWASRSAGEPRRPEPSRPEPSRPEPSRPEPSRPEPRRPEPSRPSGGSRVPSLDDFGSSTLGDFPSYKFGKFPSSRFGDFPSSRFDDFSSSRFDDFSSSGFGDFPSSGFGYFRLSDFSSSRLGGASKFKLGEVPKLKADDQGRINIPITFNK